MDLGRRIKENRLRCNLTQERLAQKLQVTPQAVSKWESEASMPDITLLPELASVFGVSIDDLFETSQEMQLERIQNMMEYETMLSREDFDYAMTRLKEGVFNPALKGRCITMMAELCLNRASGYADLAREYAMQGMELEPEKWDNHNIFTKASRGVLPDWGYANHGRIIDFYKEFVEKVPNYLSGYMSLLDHLIADYRLEEAAEVVERMKVVENTYHYPMYKGEIAWAAGNWEEAESIWNEMTEQYSDNWKAWFVRGDKYAYAGKYEDAIVMLKKSIQLQPKPRLTDNLETIAQLCMLLNDYEGAAKAYEGIIEILETDWEMTEGEMVDGYRLNVEQCRRKSEK